MTKSEELGRKEIRNGIKEKDWKLYSTDKSDKLVLDTKENYLKAMEPHHAGHSKVKIEDVNNSESNLSNHSKMPYKFPMHLSQNIKVREKTIKLQIRNLVSL